MNLTANGENIFLLEQLAEHAEQAFFIFDCSKNKLVYISPAYETIWEKGRQGLQESDSWLLDSVLPEDRRHVLRNWYWYKQVPRTDHKEFEFRILTPANSVKSVCMNLYPVRNEQNQMCLTGWARDITERKKYTNVMLKYTARKNAALEILSHDLSGFLGLIQNLAGSVAKSKQFFIPGPLLENLDLIQQICKRSTGLITNLVNHEFLESASVKLNKERQNIVTIIRDAVDMYQMAEQGLSKTFEVNVSSPEILMDIDDVKFMQVVNNLISNAMKFTPNGGTITIAVEERETNILFSIADTGIGIPARLQPVLFDKFTEASRPGLRGESSVGLGMSIIKNIVELHDGRIWIESEVNKGTTFFIEIPR